MKNPRAGLLLFLTLVLVFSGFYAVSGNAQAVEGPPMVVIQGDPVLVVIPGTYVYYVDGYQQDVFFYDGSWYRPWHNHWYSSSVYSGAWVTVNTPPQYVTGLPDGWRKSAVNAPRVDYSVVRDNWKGWHSNNYWKNNGWKGDSETHGIGNQNTGHPQVKNVADNKQGQSQKNYKSSGNTKTKNQVSAPVKPK